MFTADDHRYMARALRLAERGRMTADPNPCVGCVIVYEGQIVGEGWHVRAGEDHAEIVALRQAGSKACGATIYVTLEPCCHFGRTPPCTQVIIAARPRRIVVAMVDPNPKVEHGGIDALRTAGIDVQVGLMEQQAYTLNQGFIQRMKSGRPWVTIKLAASIDGRTAMASGESKWITGHSARRDVQRLRAGSSALLTGIGTILADDPSLTVRIAECKRQPIRVIADSQLQIPDTAKLWGAGGQVIVATAVQGGTKFEQVRARGAEVVALPGQGGQVDLGALMDNLAGREVNSLLVEAGPTLAGAMIRAGLAHQVVLYLAPKLLGDDARGMLRLSGLERLVDQISLRLEDVRVVGDDLCMRLRVVNNDSVEQYG
ncbi:MAG: bifunctional diaminohydroxyphosphoribosylaminopyrimidine deaminase/5-amino-6-(5-phosphoribosylamino)uracil reductase RibD [Gammaproteobacteria bacterium]|nr:bifunctional diaminohydroxyphosphoribosylaminopyrimidine deaminase/5-amino-6-(5-phosphoribosylamino)uracil reductase RibD [Gammaproteobacteria bacterium]